MFKDVNVRSHVHLCELVHVSGVCCHVHASSACGCAHVHFSVQSCTEDSSALSLFQAQDVQKQAWKQWWYCWYYCTFQGTVWLKLFSLFFVFVFIWYLCEKYYKPITVQYYIAKCVSWAPGLTLLDAGKKSDLTMVLSEWNSSICWGLTVIITDISWPLLCAFPELTHLIFLSTLQVGTVIIPCLQRGSWGTGRLSNLSVIAALTHARAKIWGRWSGSRGCGAAEAKLSPWSGGEAGQGWEEGVRAGPGRWGRVTLPTQESRWEARSSVVLWGDCQYYSYR